MPFITERPVQLKVNNEIPKCSETFATRMHLKLYSALSVNGDQVEFTLHFVHLVIVNVGYALVTQISLSITMGREVEHASLRVYLQLLRMELPSRLFSGLRCRLFRRSLGILLSRLYLRFGAAALTLGADVCLSDTVAKA